jgi:hypothetical protein
MDGIKLAHGTTATDQRWWRVAVDDGISSMGNSYFSGMNA